MTPRRSRRSPTPSGTSMGAATCDGLTLSGTTCTTTAPAAGDWEVRVTVTDLFLDSDSEKKRINVEAPAAPTAPGAGTAPPPTSNGTGRPRLLSPFPVVTVAGTVTEAGTSIDLLTVRAPTRCTRAGPLPRRGVPADACVASGPARAAAAEGRRATDAGGRCPRGARPPRRPHREVHALEDATRPAAQADRRLRVAGHIPDGALPRDLSAPTRAAYHPSRASERRSRWRD